MNLGLHYTLDDANSKLDPEILAIEKRLTVEDSEEFGRVWDLFGQRSAPITTDEFEIYKRTYTKPEFPIARGGAGTDWDDATDTTGLPVATAHISKITFGDVLLIVGTGEIVVVKDINRSGQTIDVYERGAGESSAVALGATGTVKVIGNANIEGTVDVEHLAEATDIYTNYCQLVEEKIELTKEDNDQNRKIGGIRQYLRDEAMRRVKQKLARTAIHGVAVAPSKTKPGMTRGLLNWLGLTDGLKSNVAGAFTMVALETAIDAIRAEGGRPNAIIMSVKNKRVFNTFTGADSVVQQVTDKTTGRIVDNYLADGVGLIPVIVDIDMPDDKIVIADTRRLTKGWKVNDELKLVEEPPTNSRQMAETLQGKFGLAVEGIGQSHYLLTGLTT